MTSSLLESPLRASVSCLPLETTQPKSAKIEAIAEKDLDLPACGDVREQPFGISLQVAESPGTYLGKWGGRTLVLTTWTSTFFPPGGQGTCTQSLLLN